MKKIKVEVALTSLTAAALALVSCFLTPPPMETAAVRG